MFAAVAVYEQVCKINVASYGRITVYKNKSLSS